MININGVIVSKDSTIFSVENRAFKYGDGVFETLKIINDKIIFIEAHYFRLMSSMRMLRMDIPMNFTLENLESEILKTLESNNLKSVSRARITVFRKDGGLYTPDQNSIDFAIEVSEINNVVKENYEVDLYKDFYVYTGLLSTIKTTNRVLNVIASIYAKENELDNCILINEKKQLVEAIQGNIFVIIGNKLITPPVSEGCIKGVVRQKIIDLVQKSTELEIEECPISPFELRKADELFITNSIIDIQPVTKYRKKTFKIDKSMQIDKLLKELYS